MLRVSLPTTWFPDNAIMRAERSHQERATNNQRRWRRYVQRAVNWGMLTIGMILFWGEFAGALTKRDASPIGQKLGVLTIVFMTYTVVWHFSLMFRTLALAANSITREKQSGSWDLLVLTGVDARQIVRGKWWATIQQQLPHYVRLGLLRACAAVYWTAINSRAITTGMFPYYISQMQIKLPTAEGILLAGIIIFAMTLANLFFTAACGVMASTVSSRSVTALVRALVLRPLALMGLVLTATLINLILYIIVRAQSLTIFTDSLGSLFDNGVGLIYPLAAIMYVFPDYDIYPHPNPLLTTSISGLLSFVFYALLTIWLLRWAQRMVIHKSDASPSATDTIYRHSVIP